MESEHKKMSDNFQKTVNQIRRCIDELESQALKTASTNSASYIQQLIDNENLNRTRGYQRRIEQLEKEKKSAELMDKLIQGTAVHI